LLGSEADQAEAPLGVTGELVGAPATADDRSAVLRLTDLGVGFPSRERVIDVVCGIDLAVHAGEIVGLVGESGSGKSMTCLASMGLLPFVGARRTSGRVMIGDQDMTDASEQKWRSVRSNQVAMVFQQPIRSLNPAFTIGQQMIETMTFNLGVSKAVARRRAVELLDQVRIPSPGQVIDDYPHMLSGGMCQRAMIAIAISCRPSLLIADEVTTALDVTVQAEILELLADLRSEFNLGILYVSHDLAVVAELCDRVMVMYAGQIVESSPSESMFSNPLHPYARGLIDSTPHPDASGRLASVPGQAPVAGFVPAGCAFHPRCTSAVAGCDAGPIALRRVEPRRQVRCILYSENVNEEAHGTS
jgi:oligopeptide/dipeptide ABC transporter ATP-binding protein